MSAHINDFTRSQTTKKKPRLEFLNILFMKRQESKIVLFAYIMKHFLTLPDKVTAQEIFLKYKVLFFSKKTASFAK